MTVSTDSPEPTLYDDFCGEIEPWLKRRIGQRCVVFNEDRCAVQVGLVEDFHPEHLVETSYSLNSLEGGDTIGSESLVAKLDERWRSALKKWAESVAGREASASAELRVRCTVLGSVRYEDVCLMVVEITSLRLCSPVKLQSDTGGFTYEVGD